MAMYLCRWPNGEFSIVNAATKDDAIIMLDEWGNAEQASLKRMPACMFDFRLRDDGEIELAEIGGATNDFVMENCYPELDKALATAEWDETGADYSAKGLAQIRAAVQRERKRLWDSQPSPTKAETELGRDIQAQTGAPSALVNRLVRDAAGRRLRKFKSEGKKPN